ncbi:zinc finger and BTB domain-containing protein 7C [Heterodontus francisci]|uniref:zinc finger and BTB domain-containing protein 7C n=1 Tax=Heterodontus francisci TaxID=7792 RepID=UPI00355BD242
MASAADDLIGIPFPDHSSELLCSLNEQRQHGLLCDVVLIVKDQEYKTHRSILAACSKYFKTLFTADTLADQHNVYQIDFVTPEALSAILEFAYTSTLTISSSNVKDVLSAAQLLEIQCVIQVCVDIIESSAGVSSDRGDPEKQSIQDPQHELVHEDFRESPQLGLKESPQQSLEEPLQQDLGEPPQEPTNESEENFQEGHHWNKEYDFQNTLASKLIEKQCTELPREFLSQLMVNDPGGCLRPVRDFSLDALLKEGLSSRGNLLNGRTSMSPLRPEFFPPFWNGGYNGFPQLVEHQDVNQLPLNLVVKKEKIKEEVKEDLPSTTSLCDFFKGIMLENAHNNLGTLKEELDFNSYLNILGPSYLAAVYPTWPLEYEKKMRPKASQQCPICNKVIQGAGKLPRHMRTHTGEKPYMCNICEVRFTRQDKLKIHMRKHTGERPYTCIHCNARFVHNYDLKNHMRIHTGVRPYQCVHCYKSFTRSDHLHRHIKRQSCRLPRPRRGRRPATWHSASLLYSQGVPSQASHSNESGTNILPRQENRLLNASKMEPGNPEKHFNGDVRNSKIFMSEAAGKERESPTASMLNGNHIIDERDRGIFAFTLSHNNTFSHLPQQYYSTGDPWGIRFNPAASIQEASK